MRQLLCRIFGHKVSEPTPGVEYCDRCHDHAAYYYDGSQWTDEERDGLVGPIRNWWWRVRNWAWPRCLHCRKRLVLRRKIKDGCGCFCSEDCEENWIPF